jgi:hypothetical protein
MNVRIEPMNRLCRQLERRSAGLPNDKTNVPWTQSPIGLLPSSFVFSYLFELRSLVSQADARD